MAHDMRDMTELSCRISVLHVGSDKKVSILRRVRVLDMRLSCLAKIDYVID